MMNAKLLILLLFGVSFLFFGCAKKAGPEEPVPQPPETVDDTEPAADDTTEQPAAPPEEEPGAEEPDEETTGEPEEVTPPAEEEEPGEATNSFNMDSLGGLFKIDTDKPLEDEGFGVDTPSSED